MKIFKVRALPFCIGAWILPLIGQTNDFGFTIGVTFTLTVLLLTKQIRIL